MITKRHWETNDGISPTNAHEANRRWINGVLLDYRARLDSLNGDSLAALKLEDLARAALG